MHRLQLLLRITYKLQIDISSGMKELSKFKMYRQKKNQDCDNSNSMSKDGIRTVNQNYVYVLMRDPNMRVCEGEILEL